MSKTFLTPKFIAAVQAKKAKYPKIEEKDLAEWFGCSRTTISRALNGRLPKDCPGNVERTSAVIGILNHMFDAGIKTFTTRKVSEKALDNRVAVSSLYVRRIADGLLQHGEPKLVYRGKIRGCQTYEFDRSRAIVVATAGESVKAGDIVVAAANKGERQATLPDEGELLVKLTNAVVYQSHLTRDEIRKQNAALLMIRDELVQLSKVKNNGG